MANNISDDLMSVFNTPSQNTNIESRNKAYKFDYNDPLFNSDAVMTVCVENAVYKVASFGDIIGITGAEKSRKTTLIASIISSALSGQNVINFHFDLRGRNIAYIDTEQNVTRFQKTQRRIHHLSGFSQNIPNYQAWQVMSLTIEERIKVIQNILDTNKNIGICVIDGLVDLCYDFNSASEAAKTIRMVMGWAQANNCTILSVLHLNKDKATLRGHLGTELQNKCDGIIQCNYDEDTKFTMVKCRRSREDPFPPFEFTQNAYGYPVLNYYETTGSEFEEPF